MHPVSSHRLRDVFNLALTDKFVSQIQFTARRCPHRIGNTYSPGVRQALKARGNIYAIAVYFTPVLDYLAQIYPNPKLDLAGVSQFTISFSHFILNRYCTLQGVADGTEIRQHGVTGIMNDSTLVFRNTCTDEVEIIPQNQMCAVFILPG
jgi:hypothetical protein